MDKENAEISVALNKILIETTRINLTTNSICFYEIAPHVDQVAVRVCPKNDFKKTLFHANIYYKNDPRFNHQDLMERLDKLKNSLTYDWDQMCLC